MKQQDKMDEALAYKWTAQALKPIERKTLIDIAICQQVADKVASAILEAYKLGASQQDEPPKDNMEWLVNKIDRKLRMFLKTKDILYLIKARNLLEDLKNEHTQNKCTPPRYDKVYSKGMKWLDSL